MTKNTARLSEIAKEIEGYDLADLKSVMAVIATKSIQHQDAHEGMVPAEVFLEKAVINGLVSAVEIITMHDGRFYLKMRDRQDQGWRGLYHFVGKVVRRGMSFERLVGELSEELFGAGRSLNKEQLSMNRVAIYNAPERGGIDCYATVYLCELSDEDTQQLEGEWRNYSLEELLAASPDTVAAVHRCFGKMIQSPPDGRIDRIEYDE